MKRASPWPPRSRREVLALVCLALLGWLAVVLALAGLPGWPAPRVAAVGLAGAAAILAGGLAWTRRFRR